MSRYSLLEKRIDLLEKLMHESDNSVTDEWIISVDVSELNSVISDCISLNDVNTLLKIAKSKR